MSAGTVVDMVRTRTVLDDLRDMMARTPGLAGRLCEYLEEQVPNDVQMSLRLPEDLVRRLEKLGAKLARNPDFAAFRVSRQAVARLAMQRGLEALEAEQSERKGGG